MNIVILSIIALSLFSLIIIILISIILFLIEHIQPLSPTLQWLNNAGSLIFIKWNVKSDDFRYMACSFFPWEKDHSELIKNLQNMLVRWWDITDHESAIEGMTVLLNIGHRASYNEEMQKLESLYPNSLLEENPNSFLSKMILAYRKHGENALLGWDMGRVAAITQCCYIVGYISMEELLDLSVDAGQKAQKYFNSWEDMMESYLLGLQYWKRDNDSNSEIVERWNLYREFRDQKKFFKKNIYKMVSFHTPLSKKILTDKYGIMHQYKKFYY